MQRRNNYNDGSHIYESTRVAPRLPQFGGRGRRIDCRVSRRRGARHPAGRRARRTAGTRNAQQIPESADTRRRHLGPDRGLRAVPQGLRSPGARSLVSRRRTQLDRAQRRSHRRNRLSAGLQLRQGSGPVTSTAARRAFPGHHKALLNYCKELDVELAPFINDNRNGLGAGRRDVRRQAGPRARIHERIRAASSRSSCRSP